MSVTKAAKGVQLMLSVRDVASKRWVLREAHHEHGGVDSREAHRRGHHLDWERLRARKASSVDGGWVRGGFDDAFVVEEYSQVCLNW